MDMQIGSHAIHHNSPRTRRILWFFNSSICHRHCCHVVADSELQVGDIVTIIGEQFTAGCTPPEVVAALVGPEKSEVEVTAKRTADGP